jgi:hypothetical protein
MAGNPLTAEYFGIWEKMKKMCFLASFFPLMTFALGLFVYVMMMCCRCGKMPIRSENSMIGTPQFDWDPKSQLIGIHSAQIFKWLAFVCPYISQKCDPLFQCFNCKGDNWKIRQDFKFLL